MIEALGKTGISIDAADGNLIHIGERSWNLEFFFYRRHIPHTAAETSTMLGTCGYASIDQFIAAAVPGSIRLSRAMEIDDPTVTVKGVERGEADVLWPGQCAHYAVSSGTTAPSLVMSVTIDTTFCA